MKASVIMPVYNQTAQLMIALEAFRNQILGYHESFEIIVVDDGSDIPVPDLAPKFSTLNVTLISQPNKGRAAARNAGVSGSSGELLIFCDCDRFPGTRFISDHILAHQQKEHLVVIGKIGEIYTKDLEKVMLNVHLDTDYYCKQMRVPFYPRTVTKLYESSGRTESGIPWISTFSGNMSVRKDEFIDAGWYDENFTSWGLEHFDLGYRLQNNGAVFFYNQSVNYHIAHSRDVSGLQQNIEDSIAYMNHKYKYSDPTLNRFKNFMCGECSLQSVEPNLQASWLGREKSPLMFKVGNI